MAVTFGKTQTMFGGHGPFDRSAAMRDAADLSAFIDHLRADLADDPDRWENATLDAFLEAMSAWVSTFPCSYLNNDLPVPSPDWQFVADLLTAARDHE